MKDLGCMTFAIGRDPHLFFSQLFPSFLSSWDPSPIVNKPTSYHFLARNALYHGLRSLDLKPGQKVLVPAYHCATLVEPIIRNGQAVIFYNVFRDGSPDFQDIESKVEKGTCALLAIHFFGIPQPIKKLKEFCKQNKLFLIEDCAHILTGEFEGEPLGSFGDVSVFSWRKFLPVYDGGLLVLNNPQADIGINLDNGSLWHQLKIAKNIFEKVSGISLMNLDRFSGMAQSVETRIVHGDDGIANPGKSSLGDIHSQSFDLDLANLRMSWFSRKILKGLNLPRICERRKQNSVKLHNASSKWPEAHPWAKTFSAGVCGWGFPMVFPEKEGMHRILRSRGVQAFNWEGVIHPSLKLKEFPDAEFLYRHLIILPNHQDLTAENISSLIHILQDVMGNSNSCLT